MLMCVVQHRSVRVNLQHVLKLSIHNDSYIGIGDRSKFQDQLKVSRFLGVESLTVSTSIGYIVKHEQRAVFVLPSIISAQHVALFFAPGSTVLEKTEVPQGISVIIVAIQL